MTQPIDYQPPQLRTRETKPRWRIFAWVLLIGLAITLFFLLNHSRALYDPLPLSDFRMLLQEDAVAQVTVEGDELRGQLKPNKRTRIVNFRTELPQGTASNWSFTAWRLENRGNALVDARNERNLLLQVLLPLVPWLLIFGFIWFFVFRMLRGAQQQRLREPTPVIVVNREPA